MKCCKHPLDWHEHFDMLETETLTYKSVLQCIVCECVTNDYDDDASPDSIAFKKAMGPR